MVVVVVGSPGGITDLSSFGLQALHLSVLNFSIIFRFFPVSSWLYFWEGDMPHGPDGSPAGCTRQIIGQWQYAARSNAGDDDFGAVLAKHVVVAVDEAVAAAREHEVHEGADLVRRAAAEAPIEPHVFLRGHVVKL